jgi:hypothetical protein
MTMRLLRHAAGSSSSCRRLPPPSELTASSEEVLEQELEGAIRSFVSGVAGDLL